MAAAVYILRWQMGTMRNWIVVAVCIPVGAIVFLGVVWLLGAPELAELRGGIKLSREVETQTVANGVS
jgi:hypothetical protein